MRSNGYGRLRKDEHLVLVISKLLSHSARVGLAGAMTIKIDDGKHFYEFDFTLPALAENRQH
jgi:hypothetical protein